MYFFMQDPGLSFSIKVLVSLFCFKYFIVSLTFKLKFISLTELIIFYNLTPLELSWLSPFYSHLYSIFQSIWTMCSFQNSLFYLMPPGLLEWCPTPWNLLNSFYHTSFYLSFLVQFRCHLLFFWYKCCHNTQYSVFIPITVTLCCNSWWLACFHTSGNS